MNAEKKEQIAGPLMVQFQEAKQQLALWLNFAEQIGSRFTGLGTLLETEEGVQNIALDAYERFFSGAAFQEIQEVQASVRKAREEMETAAEKLRSMGYRVE